MAEVAYKLIWKVDTLPKIKVFLWQMCHNALPIRGVLLKRGCNIDPRCKLCTDDTKSVDNLFTECPVTRRVWD